MHKASCTLFSSVLLCSLLDDEKSRPTKNKYERYYGPGRECMQQL